MTMPLEAIVLVPVEVFGAERCCVPEHFDQDCESKGYGLCDAVSPWSDCNRAIQHVYRVDDIGPKYREPGETVTVYVKPEDKAFFLKQFGER